MNDINIPQSPIECLNFCNGEFTKASGPEFSVVSPYLNQVIGKVFDSSEKDLNFIIAAAKKAQISWGLTPIKERTQVMFRLREILIRDLKKISHSISSECGKTLFEAEAELMKGIEVLEFAISIQNLDVGGRMEVSRGVFCEYRREPLGVVAGITPFNFPAMVPFWMIPIAITLGNAFIWKPSDKTPLTSILIAEAMNEAGLPKGIFSLVQGQAKTSEMLLTHPDVAAIGFVGSTNIAKKVFQLGSQNLKRVLALGGAKNHIFLLPDADPELTAKGVADSFTGCAGQRCMAASVLCAVASNPEDEKRINNLISGIVKYASLMKLGENMGAIISKDSLTRLEKAIGDATKNNKTKIILDGRKPQHPSNYNGGNWLSPTILDHVEPGSQAAIEELFGPVLSIIRCKSLNEAMQIQKQSIYGNAVSIFTQSGFAADEVSKYGQAGMVGVNIGVPVPREPFSFGGFFESKFGHGDITGINSLNFWSNIKKITTKWAPQKDWSWMG